MKWELGKDCEGLMRIRLDCWERGEMLVGRTLWAINFAERKLWFMISLVNVSGVLY